jgi:hypothetical protein
LAKLTNDNEMENETKAQKVKRLIVTALVLTYLGICGCALAQTPTPIKPSLQRETPETKKAAQSNRNALEKQYQGCSDGSYNGPRPGRVRFTRDPWLWVVTPEFAKKFCMPAEFISEELKGAEAIAFKIFEEPDEEICGWGDKAEICNKAKVLLFEVYINSAIRLPKLRDVPFFMPTNLPSKFLITHSESALQKRRAYFKENPYPGSQIVFNSQQIALTGLNEGKSSMFVTTLYNQSFFKNSFDGIDFMAFHGTAGLMKDIKNDQRGAANFAITFRPLNDKPLSSAGRNLGEFAHVISLPKTFTDKIRIIDATPGLGIVDLARRALAPLEK